MKYLKLIRSVLPTLLVACSLFSGTAAPVLVVERVGDGAKGLTNNATPVFLQLYGTDGTDLGLLNLPHGNVRPTAAPFYLMDGGSTDSQGQLTRSVNGTLIQMPGYNATNGEVNVVSSSANRVRRTIGLLKPDTTGIGAQPYVIDTSRAVSMLDSNNYRSVVSVDGTRFWAAGKAGAWYVNGNSATLLTDLNFRCINIFNGQLFCSFGGSTPGLYTIGSGLPTTTPALPYIFLSMAPTASPFAFQMSTAMNVCYIADDNTNSLGGIVKYTLSGGVWYSNYTLRVGGPVGARGLTVDWSRPGVPVVYATTAESSSNRVVRIVDTGAASTAILLGLAPRHTVFRGVDFMSQPAVWRYASSWNWSVGGTTPWYQWSTCLANGSAMQFQDVNTGTISLSLSTTNNTSLITVSSIAFTTSGYGSGAGTSYTLRGNGLNISGGITSDTTLNQTIRLPLTVTGPQVFQTGPGNLTVDGSLAGNSALTKNGSGALVLNATNRFTGPLTVYGGSLVVNGIFSNSILNVVTATLGGTGSIYGPVNIQSGGAMSPDAGTPNTEASLSIHGAVNLLGTTSLRLRKSGTNCYCDSVKGISMLNCGGTLNLTVSGTGALQPGDTFNLFKATEFSGSFAVVNLPPLDPALYWDTTQLASTGALKVLAITPPAVEPLIYQSDGTVVLRFSGLPGLTYKVWATGDLTWGWSMLGTGTFSEDGSGSFYDWQAQFYPYQRFYQISVP